MDQRIVDSCYKFLRNISGFETQENILLEEGHIINKAHSVERSTNCLGTCHGGFIFTICDIAAGMSVQSLNKNNVTLQASMNYIKALPQGIDFYADAYVTHRGKSTCVVEVSVYDDNKTLYNKGLYTFYVLGPVLE